VIAEVRLNPVQTVLVVRGNLPQMDAHIGRGLNPLRLETPVPECGEPDGKDGTGEKAIEEKIE